MTGKIQITLKNGREFCSDQDETILESALKQGYSIEHSCKTGTCGICETTILDAESKAIVGEKILTCCYKPSCSLTIDSEYFEELKDIKSQVSPAKIDEIVHRTEDVLCLFLRLPPRVDFKYLPGQYLDLIVQGTKRSYSIASKPREDKRIELHFKKVPDGEMSSKIFAPISAGQLVQIEGPKGTF
ncbi:FAD-binding oxidoreductase [Marinomonas pontica]|uniref:FAD-binding oxidoreductase n=1 Tax=Marinomonas pontica TaxID=264739 RepID=UPI0022431619|nr:FAD-binding oxidoreductase [Marinomonas pontica]MCW8354488.1 FAD-binding oxidoreductase [Marinomonas pontica]